MPSRSPAGELQDKLSEHDTHAAVACLNSLRKTERLEREGPESMELLSWKINIKKERKKTEQLTMATLISLKT